MALSRKVDPLHFSRRFAVAHFVPRNRVDHRILCFDNARRIRRRNRRDTRRLSRKRHENYLPQINVPVEIAPHRRRNRIIGQFDSQLFGLWDRRDSGDWLFDRRYFRSILPDGDFGIRVSNRTPNGVKSSETQKNL